MARFGLRTGVTRAVAVPRTARCALIAALALTMATFYPTATSHADNSRLNKSFVANVYAIHRQIGCPDVRIPMNPQLQLAAEWHARDLMANRALDGDIGSDGSTPEMRAFAAGYTGTQVAETVVINPALAISGVELVRAVFANPAQLAIVRNCDFTEMGVWSENSLDRTVVVAMYGKPADESG